MSLFNQIKDKNHRPIDHPDYDPSTLYVPQEYINKATPAMKQYWEFKKNNYDKILLFKLGKFYEMFFDDAIIGNKVLGLNWMGSDTRKLHVGFPEVMLNEKSLTLVREGYKVAVIEQTETPEQLKKRLSEGKDKKEKVVKRRVCNVFSRGTVSNDNEANNKFIFCLTCNNSDTVKEEAKEWGVTIIDLATLECYAGILADSSNYKNIQSILFNTAPEEVVLMVKNTPRYIEKFASSLSSQPIINKIKYQTEEQIKAKLVSTQLNIDFTQLGNAQLASVYLLVCYLEGALLDDKILPLLEIQSLDKLSCSARRMVLDYQTVSNLDLVETSVNKDNLQEGSLLEYLDKTVTNGGKRLLKKWILHPLLDIELMEERLNVVQFFLDNHEVCADFRERIGGLTDIDKKLGKIYKLAVKETKKVIYFENYTRNRMNEFNSLLTSINKALLVFRGLRETCQLSEEIIEILEGTDFIDLIGKINKFQSIYEQTVEDGKKCFQLKEGLFKEYDEKLSSLGEIDKTLEEIKEEAKIAFDCNNIALYYSKVNTFEIEVPEMVGLKPAVGYELTSSRKGYRRFQNDRIISTIALFQKLEEEKKDTINEINQEIFKEFTKDSQKWSQMSFTLSRLDILSGFAVLASEVNF